MPKIAHAFIRIQSNRIVLIGIPVRTIKKAEQLSAQPLYVRDAKLFIVL
jgi:hypothetical protein